MNDNMGWICPRCGVAHNPSVMRCDCAHQLAPIYPNLPTIPMPSYPLTPCDPVHPYLVWCRTSSTTVDFQ